MIAAMTKKMKIIRAKQIKLLHREKIERKRFHYTGRSYRIATVLQVLRPP